MTKQELRQNLLKAIYEGPVKMRIERPLECYSLAPNPYEWMSLYLLNTLPFEPGDIEYMDTFLLNKILKQIPDFASPPGATHLAPGIVRFLARNGLILACEDGMTLSVLGAYLVNYFETNPPVPGKVNFPTDFGLDQLPDPEKFYGLTKHLYNRISQD